MDNDKKINILVIYIFYILLFTEVMITAPEFLTYRKAVLGCGVCLVISFLIHLIAHKKLNILYLIGATINYAGFGLLCSTYNSYNARQFDTGMLVLSVLAVVVFIIMITNVESLTTSVKRTSIALLALLMVFIIVSLMGWLMKDNTFCSYVFYYLFIAMSCLYVCYEVSDDTKNACFEISIGSFLFPVIVVKLLLDRRKRRMTY